MSKSTGCRNEPSTSENDTMMRTLFLFAALTLALTAGSCCGEPKTELFNGRDLTGWVCVTDPESGADVRETFSVRDGEYPHRGPSVRVHAYGRGLRRLPAPRRVAVGRRGDEQRHFPARAGRRPALARGCRMSVAGRARGRSAGAGRRRDRRSGSRADASRSSGVRAATASGLRANGTVPRSSAWAVTWRFTSTASCRTSVRAFAAGGISRFRARAVPWSSATSG